MSRDSSTLNFFNILLIYFHFSEGRQLRGSGLAFRRSGNDRTSRSTNRVAAEIFGELPIREISIGQSARALLSNFEEVRQFSAFSLD